MPETDQPKRKLPFNNLFLNAGVVNGYNIWWMYIFGIAATILGYLSFQLIVLSVLVKAAANNGIGIEELEKNRNLLSSPEQLGMDKNLYLALVFGMFVFALIGLYFAVTKIHKKSFVSIITSYEKVRFKRFFFAFAVWGTLIVSSILISYYMDKDAVTVQFEPFNFFMLMLVTVIFMPIQTATEEFIFRGYLVQGLSMIFKNGLIPIIITSLIFGLVHMSNPEAEAFGWHIMLPYYALFGLFLGILTLLDEGLELALGIHCANNIISGLLVTSPNSVLKTDAIFLLKTEDPAAELLGWVILASITFIIFWLKYRWKNFNLIVK